MFIITVSYISRSTHLNIKLININLPKLRKKLQKLKKLNLQIRKLLKTNNYFYICL